MRWEKRPWHWWHWKGFSPECSRRWVFRLLLLLKRLWHVCGGESVGGLEWVLYPGSEPPHPPFWHLLGTYRALVGLLASVHQLVLLQVCQLREALLADGAREGPLATVHPQVDLPGGGGAQGYGGGHLRTQESGLPQFPLPGSIPQLPGHGWSTEGYIRSPSRCTSHRWTLCWGETEARGEVHDLPAQLGQSTAVPCPHRGLTLGRQEGWAAGLGGRAESGCWGTPSTLRLESCPKLLAQMLHLYLLLPTSFPSGYSPMPAGGLATPWLGTSSCGAEQGIPPRGSGYPPAPQTGKGKDPWQRGKNPTGGFGSPVGRRVPHSRGQGGSWRRVLPQPCEGDPGVPMSPRWARGSRSGGLWVPQRQRHGWGRRRGPRWTLRSLGSGEGGQTPAGTNSARPKGSFLQPSVAPCSSSASILISSSSSVLPVGTSSVQRGCVGKEAMSSPAEVPQLVPLVALGAVGRGAAGGSAGSWGGGGDDGEFGDEGLGLGKPNTSRSKAVSAGPGRSTRCQICGTRGAGSCEGRQRRVCCWSEWGGGLPNLSPGQEPFGDSQQLGPRPWG